MKKTILITTCLILLLLTGCTTTSFSNPAFFNDTGNKIDNYGVCNDLLSEACSQSYNCISYKITILECDDGKCFCD